MEIEIPDGEKSKYTQLFEGYRLNSTSLRYQIIFFLRRYLMLLILTLLPKEEVWPILLQMHSTMYVIGYIGG